MFEPLAKLPWSSRDHWVDGGRKFRNPWPSFNPNAGSKLSALKIALFHPPKIPVPENIEDYYPVITPKWHDFKEDVIRSTWIGHATFIVEFPSLTGRGIRVLFDPVFSHFTSPEWAAKLGLGPVRYSRLPCDIHQVPEIDVVVMSHNHYDHLDYRTVRDIESMTNSKTQYICGLNNARYFTSFGVQKARIHEMDWGDASRVIVDGVDDMTISCCPAQHTSARSITDTDHGLWCSWVIEHKRKKVFFAGDTGYRYTPSDERAGYPVNPVFKQIGEHFGGFDVSMIPIGLYSPRGFMSNVHCCPEDAVDLHKDVKSRLSIAMHYGTFRGGLSRNFEDVLDPPRRLRAYMSQLEIPDSQFRCLSLGGSINT